MLPKRIISAVFLTVVIIAALTSRWFFSIAVIVFIILGLYEFFTMVEKKGINIYKYVGIGMGVIIPLSILFRFELTKKWELTFITLLLLFLLLMQLSRRQNSGAIVGISTTLFGILYVSWFLSFLIKIRFMPNGTGLLAAILLMTKLGDVGSYLIGSRFGKIPLMPRISPKKTVEGAIGGLVFSLLGALGSKFFLGFSYLHLIIMGLAISALGQLGDLSESLIKRDCGVKDSSDILPGMGGILDEIDSLLFTAPVFYFYITNILK